MEEYGRITVSEHRTETNHLDNLSYSWVGPPTALITMRLAYAVGYKDGDLEMTFGPYRVRVVDHDWPRDALVVVRVDYPFWRFLVLSRRLGEKAIIAYSRMILTLAVWGLADYHRDAIPTYRDIYLVQRFRKWAKRWK